MPLWDNYVHCFVLTVVYALGYSISDPLWPTQTIELLEHEQDLDATQRAMWIASVSAGYFMTKTVAAPLIGFVSDRMGRRACMAATFAGTGLSVMGMAWVTTVRQLFVARLCMGMFAANGAMVHSHLGDIADDEGLTPLYSMHQTAWQIARLSAVMALVAASRLFGWEEMWHAYVIAGCCLLAASVYAFVSVPIMERRAHAGGHLTVSHSAVDSDEAPVPFWDSFRATFAHPLCLLMALTPAAAPVSDTSTLVLALPPADAAEGAHVVSAAQSVRGLLAIAFMLMPTLRAWMRSHSNHAVILWAAPPISVGIVALALVGVRNFGWLMAVVAVKDAAYLFWAPARDSLMMHLTPPGVAGAANGWRHCLKGLTGVVASYVTAFLLTFGAAVPFWWKAAVVAAESSFVYWYISRHPVPPIEAAAAAAAAAAAKKKKNKKKER